MTNSRALRARPCQTRSYRSRMRPATGGEIRVPGKDPTAMSPRAKRIGAEPAPQGRPANFRDQPLGDHFAPNLGKRKSRQGQLQAMGEFTGESFHLDDDAGGKSGRV